MNGDEKDKSLYQKAFEKTVEPACEKIDKVLEKAQEALDSLLENKK